MDRLTAIGSNRNSKSKLRFIHIYNIYERINLQLISDAGKRQTKTCECFNRIDFTSHLSHFYATLDKQLTKTSKVEANYV